VDWERVVVGVAIAEAIVTLFITIFMFVPSLFGTKGNVYAIGIGGDAVALWKAYVVCCIGMPCGIAVCSGMPCGSADGPAFTTGRDVVVCGSTAVLESIATIVILWVVFVSLRLPYPRYRAHVGACVRADS
jgi:hypothetical protein